VTKVLVRQKLSKNYDNHTNCEDLQSCNYESRITFLTINASIIINNTTDGSLPYPFAHEDLQGRSDLVSLKFCNSPMKVSVPRSVELKPLLALDMSLSVISSFFMEDASFSFRLSLVTRSRDRSRCLRWMTFSPRRLLVRCRLTSMSESSRSSCGGILPSSVVEFSRGEVVFHHAHNYQANGTRRRVFVSVPEPSEAA